MDCSNVCSCAAAFATARGASDIASYYVKQDLMSSVVPLSSLDNDSTVSLMILEPRCEVLKSWEDGRGRNAAAVQYQPR